MLDLCLCYVRVHIRCDVRPRTLARSVGMDLRSDTGQSLQRSGRAGKKSSALAGKVVLKQRGGSPHTDGVGLSIVGRCLCGHCSVIFLKRLHFIIISLFMSYVAEQ